MEPFCYFSKNESRPEEVIANYGCKELSKPLHKINVTSYGFVSFHFQHFFFHVQVHLKIFVKMSSQYFQIGYFPKVDYCEFIKNVDKQNLLYNGVKLLKKKLPDAVKDCPYKEKQLQVNNLVLTQDDFEYIPSGKYKIVCIFSDDQDEKILKMTTYFKI